MNDFADTAPAEQSPVAEPQVEAPEAQQEAPAQDTAAPEAPAEDAPRRSRREALEKAFSDMGDEGDDTGATDTTDGPARGPDGKFVAKEGQPEKAPAEKPVEGEAQPQKAPINEAPQRFSPDAKAAWEQTPEPVRGEINRAFAEMERGIQEHQQRYEPLKPFYEMAEQHGVNLPDVLGNYVQMEQTLRQDPRRGLEALARNMGVSLDQLIGQATGQGQPQGEKDQHISRLEQELHGLKQQLGGVSQTIQEQRTTAVQSQVEQFAAQNPRFEELAPEIKRLLETGYADSLEDAYSYAERLNPAPQPAQPAPAAPAQTRKPRSVTGAPNAGSNPGTRKPSANRQEALASAFSRAGLA